MMIFHSYVNVYCRVSHHILINHIQCIIISYCITLRCHQTWQLDIPYVSKVSSCENHQTKWGTFQQTMCDIPVCQLYFHIFVG